MLFTPQQLQGGQKYAHKTRIGNWKEDMELEEIKQTDYNEKKNGSQLNFHKTLTKYEQSSKKVTWSFSKDGYLRSGDHILIMNKKTNGYLTMDIGDKVNNLDEAFMVTTTPQDIGPVTRSVFVIKKEELMDVFGSDNIIRYGQKIRIEANPNLYRKPLYLSSSPLTPNVHSPVTRLQEASISAKDCFYDTWIIDYLDPNFRFEKQGEPVPANQPILIRHCSTSHYLASDLTKYKNDFGTEYEVCVHSFASKNRSQNLALEKQGKLTGDVPSKFQEDQNIFLICTSPNPSYAKSIEELNKFTIQDLIKEIKEKIIERSTSGIRGISKIFKAMDNNGNHSLDVDDFRWGLLDFGIQITKEEAQKVLEHFDRDKNGQVDFNEFIRALKGDMNEFRKRIVKQAYDKLDVNRDGLVKLDDIAKIYDVSQHPEIVQGRKSPEEVYMEFLSLWDTQQKDGIVTLEEFYDYYSDISASIERDDYFALFMRNAWKL